MLHFFGHFANWVQSSEYCVFVQCFLVKFCVKRDLLVSYALMHMLNNEKEKKTLGGFHKPSLDVFLAKNCVSKLA